VLCDGYACPFLQKRRAISAILGAFTKKFEYLSQKGVYFVAIREFKII
jgi:hypothetical protein